jgi:hypothetical protein
MPMFHLRGGNARRSRFSVLSVEAAKELFGKGYLIQDRWDRTRKYPGQHEANLPVAHFVKTVHDPRCAVFQIGEVFGVKCVEEWPRIVLGLIEKPLWRGVARNETTANHEHQSALDELATYQKFAGAERQCRMNARRPIDIARVDHNVVVLQKPLQIELRGV